MDAERAVLRASIPQIEAEMARVAMRRHHLEPDRRSWMAARSLARQPPFYWRVQFGASERRNHYPELLWIANFVA